MLGFEQTDAVKPSCNNKGFRGVSFPIHMRNMLQHTPSTHTVQHPGACVIKMTHHLMNLFKAKFLHEYILRIRADDDDDFAVN